MKKSTWPIRAAIAALLLPATAVAVPTASAESATPDRITSSGLSARSPELSASATSTVTNGPWSCTLTASNPNRWFGGSGGGEQGIGSVSCTGGVVMPAIYVAVGLYRNGSLIASDQLEKANSIVVNRVASASPHVSAAYETGALGAVLWPDNTITEIPQIYSIVVRT
ncbi:hypothetical protein KCV87_34600 [Actinosynnema pretiosum subsp. pretiosum]|uniref:Secreted protein n=1 Tax=Actinosynnema pretiosum subsp. pretiosum TaxID=103721 RepID=A0AA45L6E2_9PSEU|nr:hypothetical protein APASM_4233 [Actinosynnema pretiosum subsp. pretiosum]QUF04379.1 hypothetical protein KCV87_34600 [Actinosynnema pretiosum subsp. pretiosum]